MKLYESSWMGDDRGCYSGEIKLNAVGCVVCGASCFCCQAGQLWWWVNWCVLSSVSHAVCGVSCHGCWVRPAGWMSCCCQRSDSVMFRCLSVIVSDYQFLWLCCCWMMVQFSIHLIVVRDCVVCCCFEWLCVFVMFVSWVDCCLWVIQLVCWCECVVVTEWALLIR